MLEGILIGLSAAVTPFNLIMVVMGCVIGTLIGMLPGLGPMSIIAIMIPVAIGIGAHLGEHGFGLFAIERKGDGAFLGFTGLNHGPAGTPVEDDIEIGWRLARAYWRQGYAHEAASACLDWFWRETLHPRLVSFTTVSNTPSQNLMRKLGFEHRPDMDFDHPAIARDHPLSPHRVFVLERGSRSDG